MSKLKTKSPFDETAKQYLREKFEALGTHVETEFESYHQSMTIDMTIECRTKDIAALQGTAFSHFRTLNVVELKGPSDNLRDWGFDEIMQRAWEANRLSPYALEEKPKKKLTKQQEEDGEDDTPSNYAPAAIRTTTIVSVIKPVKLLQTLKDVYQFHQTDEPGVYLSKQIVPIWIIHPDELEMIPKNYPLLCLSRGEKLQAFIDLCMREGLDEYLKLILKLGETTNQNEIWTKLMEAMNVKTKILPETWGYIDEFFRKMPETYDNVPTIHERIQRVQEEARTEGVEQGRGEGALANQRKLMIKLLNRNFGNENEELLETIIDRIEENSDLAALEEWYDRILDAHSLRELDF
ncbi:MAG: hypothetical protein AAF639_18145 [Chloroflexota bacterium]